MKGKIRTLLILVAVLCLPLTARATEEHDFSAGSLIIPMDSYYQPGDDGGLLEAYGLVYYLLNHTDEDGEHDIKVYWIINQEKTTIDGIDMTIADNTLLGSQNVVAYYDHAGGLTTFTSQDYARPGDSNKQISYAGGVFIVEAEDAAVAKALIDSKDWLEVKVHQALIPFAATVFREMIGTPPKIALMNNNEDKTKGNAQILEAYLRLAGLCTDTYEVVTPYEIAGIAPDGSNMVPKLRTAGYDFLWAPHWTGYDKQYAGDFDGDGTPDVEEVVSEIKLFLESGNGLLAECASIETFEHSENGHFLSTKGFGHNGGTNDETKVLYNDVTAANSQIGDFSYDPEGGHLHNWRPYHSGDPYNFAVSPDVTGGDSAYVATVSRFTVDDTNVSGAVDPTDWDYYVGGYAYGDTTNGYVVYLGGHKYATCKGDVAVDPEMNAKPLEFEFKKDVDKSDKVYTITLALAYNDGSSKNIQTTFDTDDNFSAVAKVGDPLEIDLTTASVHKKKLTGVTLRNKGTSLITVNGIYLEWSGGEADQKIKKIVDTATDVKLFDGEQGSPLVLAPSAFTIKAGETTSAGCTNNDDCAWTNIAGVRYVLNTLFNIKYQITSKEYARSAPIVNHPYLYQGSFEYPSYFGHFRKYLVTEDYAEGEEKVAVWDTAGSGHITNANSANSDGRKVYTAALSNGAWSKVNFDAGNLSNLNNYLSVTPEDGDTDDEEKVVTRVRGKNWDYDNGQWVERANKLGGIEHSAPAIVDHNSRTGSRDEVAYVGDLYGMLHAIDTTSGNEKWAFIPRNLLFKLKNDRTDPNAAQDFAAVDGSPTVKDVFYDHDGNPSTADQWRTILVCPQGWGGNYVFALDVTDPDNFSVLWEVTADTMLHYTGTGGFSTGAKIMGETWKATGEVVTDDTVNKILTIRDPVGEFKVGKKVFVDGDGDGHYDAGEFNVTVSQIDKVGLGHAYRASLNRVKWPVKDGQGNITGYVPKWVVYVATGYLNIAEDQGGISVLAFDLATGNMLWNFTDEYLSSVNDIPGAVTLFDSDGDNFMDQVYVGDMEGRLWELDAVDGTNPNGTGEITIDGDTITKQMPLWNAGVGKPISVSPAITRVNGHVILIFGTGGADWAANDQAYSIYAVDATEKQVSPVYWDAVDEQGGSGTLLWQQTLAAGEKVWSAPTIAAGRVYVATYTGTMESDDPSKDLAGAGYVYAFDLETGAKSWQDEDSEDENIQQGRLGIFKSRGSIYVDSQHLYLTTIEKDIIQIGDGNFIAGNANNAVLKAWRQF
jgi:hypothetical protein